MGVYKYSDDRRNDPETRDKVERVIIAQNALMLKAAKQLKELATEMHALSGMRDSHSIYERSYDTVFSAAWKVEHDSDFMNRDGGPNDCYIGNMAAGEMGEHLQKVNMEERFGGKV